MVITVLKTDTNLVNGKDGSDAGQAIDVGGSVQRIEANDEASLLLGFDFDHIVHFFRNCDKIKTKMLTQTM